MLVFYRKIQNRTSRTFAKFHCPHQSYPAGHSLPFLADFLNRSYWIVNTFHEKTIFVLDLAIMRNKSESEKDDEKENQIDKIMLRTAAQKNVQLLVYHIEPKSILLCATNIRYARWWWYESLWETVEDIFCLVFQVQLNISIYNIQSYSTFGSIPKGLLLYKNSSMNSSTVLVSTPRYVL